MAPPKKPPPPQTIMVPLLLALAAATATPFAILAAGSPPSADDKYPWLPWVLAGLGLVGLAVAIFEQNPQFDPKQSAKANAMVLLFGPVGSRIGYALICGGFIGGGIGLLVA